MKDFISALDLALLQRCRYLSESISGLHRVLPSPKTVAALETLGVDNLPPNTPRKVRRKLTTILRCKTLLDERQAEFDSIVCQAECVAHRIKNHNLRRIAKLYCLDGKNVREIVQECSVTTDTVYRWLKVLNRPPETV